MNTTAPPTNVRCLIALLLVTAAIGTAPPVHATDGPDGPTEIVAHDCIETQASFAASADDFDGIPDGFSLVRDPLGQAIVVAVTRACTIQASPAVSTIAVVLVEAPAALARPGADHAILLTPSMSTPGPLVDVLHAWGITDVTTRPMSHETQTVAAAIDVVESRTRGEPDFLLTIHAAGESDALPYATMRTFQLDIPSRAITGAYDTERSRVDAIGGPATAHFISQGVTVHGGVVFIDIPSHRAGVGAIMVSPPTDIVFRPVSPAAPDSASSDGARP